MYEILAFPSKIAFDVSTPQYKNKKKPPRNRSGLTQSNQITPLFVKSSIRLRQSSLVQQLDAYFLHLQADIL
jgi:hypothetical protein